MIERLYEDDMSCPLRAAILAASLALAGCASDYQTFYQPVASSAVLSMYIDAPMGPPAVRVSTGDIRRDQEIMYTDGFGAIGYSSFNGPVRNISSALEQAKKVGAAYVVASREYTNTMSGAIPLTTPTMQSSYTNGTVNTFGSGGYGSGSYSGTTTTYGTETTYMPYSVARYDQEAVYFAPLKRAGFGVLARALSDDEAKAVGTQKGIMIRAVRRHSPAYDANILPGDVIEKVNEVAADDPAQIRSYFKLDNINHVTIVRDNRTMQISAVVPISW